MDNSVRDPATRLDRWFYHVSRGQWTNSPIAGFRGDFAYFAFRLGTTRSLSVVAHSASLVARSFLSSASHVSQSELRWQERPP